jgi:hypothetical protein
MRHILAAALLACLVVVPTASHAQQLPGGYRANIPSVPAPDEARTARNTLYVELLGSGALYSLNYERFFTDDISARVGAMYLGLDASSVSTTGVASASANLLVVPVTVSYLGLSSGAHAFELGAGVDIVYFSASAKDSTGTSAFGSGSGVGGTAIIGYRYAPKNGGFNFRAALTPLFGQGGFLPWFGLSFGYGF